MIDQRGRLLMAAVGSAGCTMPSYDRALWALRTWLDSWPGIGHAAMRMHRQGYDLQLTQYDDRGWRATFYTTGMEHSPRMGARAEASGPDCSAGCTQEGWQMKQPVRRAALIIVLLLASINTAAAECAFGPVKYPTREQCERVRAAMIGAAMSEFTLLVRTPECTCDLELRTRYFAWALVGATVVLVLVALWPARRET
jgi:hypothetical protein